MVSRTSFFLSLFLVLFLFVHMLLLLMFFFFSSWLLCTREFAKLERNLGFPECSVNLSIASDPWFSRYKFHTMNQLFSAIARTVCSCNLKNWTFLGTACIFPGKRYLIKKTTREEQSRSQGNTKRRVIVQCSMKVYRCLLFGGNARSLSLLPSRKFGQRFSITSDLFSNPFDQRRYNTGLCMWKSGSGKKYTNGCFTWKIARHADPSIRGPR